MLTKPLPGVMDDPLHPISQGCVCHLLFNEGTGSLAYDVSGHGNHGALKNMSPNAQDSGWGGSKFGGGLAFDGTDDYVACGNDVSLQSGTSGSVGFFMFFPEVVAQEEAVVVKASNWGFAAQAWRFALYDEAQGPILRFNVGDGITHSGWVSTLLDSDTWYHIVATWNDGITRLYKNGVEVDDGAYSFSITLDHNVYIGDWGSSAPGSAFSGIIDDVHIYNRALTEEAKQLYYDPFCNSLQVPAWQLYTPAELLKPCVFSNIHAAQMLGVATVI